MTLTEFKLAHIYPIGNPILGKVDRPLNLLYNDYGALGYRLDAIAIRITQANRQQLAQATNITCGLGAQDGYVTVDIQSKTIPVEKSIQGEYYIYAIAPEVHETSLRPVLSPSTVAGGYYAYLLVEPSLSIDTISKNEYTVLLNSDTVTRTSNYMSISDRVESTLNPVNLDSIIAGTALPADTQDSLYSDTGWYNARYGGTPTNASNYGGIDPTITGITFSGAFYSKSTENTNIQSASIDTRTIKEYLYLPGVGSEGSLPTPAIYNTTPDSNYITVDPLVATSDIILLEAVSSNVRAIKQGDFMTILQHNSSTVREIIKVAAIDNIEEVAGKLQYNLIVERGLFDKPAYATSQTSISVNFIKNVSRIFETQQNKLQFVGEGKIWVQTSGDILNIDRNGFSATGSLA